MKLITELNQEVTILVEGEGPSKRLFIEGIFLQDTIKNKNGRVYPPDVMMREATRYIKEYVEDKRAYGELGHPDTPAVNLDRVSHRIVSLTREGSNWHGKAQISSTPMGNIAKGLIEDGGKLAVSSRGLGTLKESGGVKIVQDDFRLATAADIVFDPSAPAAFVNGLYESKEWVWENGILREQVVEELKNKIDNAHKIDKVEATQEAYMEFLRLLGETGEVDDATAHKRAKKWQEHDAENAEWKTGKAKAHALGWGVGYHGKAHDRAGTHSHHWQEYFKGHAAGVDDRKRTDKTMVRAGHAVTKQYESNEYLKDKLKHMDTYGTGSFQGQRDSKGEHMGHKIEFSGTSYSAPSLKLHGYATKRQLQNAIKKKVSAK